TTIFHWISLCARLIILKSACRWTTTSCANSSAREKSCMKKPTREWLRKAQSDYRVAKKILGMKPMPTDEVCFHRQQAVAQFPTALLQDCGIAFSQTHNLETLGHLLVPHHASLATYQHRLKFLSQFAVDYRYPGMHASARQARSALRWA